MLDSFLGLCVLGIQVWTKQGRSSEQLYSLCLLLPARVNFHSVTTGEVGEPRGQKHYSTALHDPSDECKSRDDSVRLRLDDKHSLHPWPFQVALLSRAGHSGHMCWHPKLPLEIQPPGGRGLNSPLNRLSNDQATHVGAYHVLHGAAPDALSVRKGSSQKTWCRSDRQAN